MIGKPKTTKLIGKGAFMRARLVVRQKNPAKRVDLSGKVIKEFDSKVTARQGAHLRRVINEYKQELEVAGIKIQPTKVVLAPTNKTNQYRLVLVQNYLPKQLFLDNYIKTCSPEAAIKIYKMANELVNKMESYNKKNTKTIGLDMGIPDLAISEGQVIVVDLWPAYLKGNETLTPTDMLSQHRKVSRKIKRVLFPKRGIARMQKAISNKMNPSILRKGLQRVFYNRRPELIKEFEKITQETAGDTR